MYCQRRDNSYSRKLLICLLIIPALTLTLSSCTSRLSKVGQSPANIDLNGVWTFISEDQSTYDQFKRRVQNATAMATVQLIKKGDSNMIREQAQPNRMLLDMLIGLLSLPREEIFFNQTDRTIEVDYGVAGYHSFPIAVPTKMVMAGAELDAVAGWENDELLIHILVTDQFQIYQRFRLMDSKNLLETMEIKLSSNQRLRHQRWYRVKTK